MASAGNGQTQNSTNPDGYGLGKFEIFRGAGQCYPHPEWP